MSTYPVEFKQLEDRINRLENVLRATKTFLLRMEATGICGRISTTEGLVYTMRKKVEQALKGE